MDQILVDNREFFIHHLHWTLPLILTVLGTLDRGIGLQSATEILLSLEGGGVRECFNCLPPPTPVWRVYDLLMHLFYSMWHCN